MELALLTAPLADTEHGGVDLSFSPEFDAIEQARRSDDPSLDQGEWVIELKQADWSEVVRICSDLLSHRTKDLRLAVWLTEALTKTQGIRGLAQGYQLLTALCSSQWDQLHPLPDGDDQDERIGNLDWLLSRSSTLIRELPLTQSDKGNYSSIDLETARNLDQAIERSPGDVEELQRNARVTQAQFDAAREDTPGSFFTTNLIHVEAAQRALRSLQTVVDQMLGIDGPAFGAARDALDALQHSLERFAAAAGIHPMDNLQHNGPQVADGASANDTTATTAALNSRAQALQQLRQVADFFRDTEPHSPVAYLADKAAQWGEMSLHQWLRTVVKDDGALAHVEELLGLPSNQSSQSAS